MADTASNRGHTPRPETLSTLTAGAREAWAAENRAAAGRLVACYALFRECVRAEAVTGVDAPTRPGYAVVDPFTVCAGQVVSAMAISVTRAETMISFAADLHERYPAILAAMVAGRMDQRAAALLARQMATVDPAVLGTIQQEVVDDYLASLEAGIRLGAQAVRDAVDRIIARHDADGIRERRKAASRDRGVSVRKGVDGMATLWANLAADEAAVLSEAIDQRVAEHEQAEAEAAAVAEAEATAAAAASSSEGTGGDPGAASAPDTDTSPTPHYSRAERRADALMSLVCGDVGPGGDFPAGSRAGADTDDDSSSTAGTVTRLRPKVTVIAGGDVGDGGAASVEFARTGRAALASLLDMLATCDGASIERIDPTPGAADDPDRARTYRPSAELARRIRLRDGTCRHPGCTAPAEFGDLDHVQPFDHANPDKGGPTTEWNLMILCRRHHRFKTFSDWIYALKPDGTLIVITSDGAAMVTKPSGPLARYREEQKRAEDAAWGRQQARMSDLVTGDEPATEPTYWTRRNARLRAERRRTERDRAEQDRAERDTTEHTPAEAFDDATASDGTRDPYSSDPGSSTSSTSSTDRATRAARAARSYGPYGPGGPAANDDTAAEQAAASSRWWARNAPVISTIEQGIESLLEELRDPPPF